MLTLNQRLALIRNDLDGLRININSDFSGGIIEYTVSTISNIDEKVYTMNTDITSLSGTVDTILTNVSSLSGSLAMNTDFTSLSGTVDTILTNVSSLSGTVDTILTNVSSLSGTVDTILTNATSLSGTVDTILTNATSLSGTVDSILTNVSFSSLEITSLSGTVDSILTNVSSLSGTMDTIITQLRNDIDRINISDFSGGVFEYTIETISILDEKVDNKQDVIIDLSANGFLLAGANITFDTSGSNITINSTGIDFQSQLDELSANVLSLENTNQGIIVFKGFRAVSATDFVLYVGAGGGNISAGFNSTSTDYSYDTDNLFDVSSGIFTCDQTGLWEHSYQLRTGYGSTQFSQNINTQLSRNNGSFTTIINMGDKVWGNSDGTSTIIPLQSGDRIYLALSGNAGWNFEMGPTRSFWQMRYVGLLP